MERRPGKISASMMCADLLHLREDIEIFEKNGVEYLHIDVMDGEFVPNLGLGADYLRGLREMTRIPLDLHLMVSRPEEKLRWLGIRPDDQVSIHFESTDHIHRAIERARNYSCRVMLALNPATPIYSVEEMLEYIDGVTVLTVDPGYAGQQIVHSCIDKTARMKCFLTERGYPDLDIEVDGNISLEHARLLRALGANLFVAGSSSIFPRRGLAADDRLKQMRDVIA